MQDDNPKTVSCVDREKMKFEPLDWNNITFWALPNNVVNGTYKKFEIYSLKGGCTYRLIETNPYENTHPSGWDLWLDSFDNQQTPVKLSNMPVLKNVTFKELFCYMAILFIEDNKLQDNSTLLSVNEVEDIKSKCQSMLNNIPSWLNPMIKLNNKWVANKKSATTNKVVSKSKNKQE